jgi:CarboxypepD_reg-like domain
MSPMSRISQLSFVLVLMLNFSVVFCQQKEFVEGKLINAKTQEPIPFASIRIKNKTIGLISNLDGGFKIPIDLKKIGATLQISSIGYKSKEVLLSSLSINQINRIYLVEAIEALEEVVITTSKRRKRLKAKEIVSLAVAKIPQNFPEEPFSYVGYYRDYQLQDGNYLNLNEAILAVFDPGFGINDLEETKIRIYQYKENLDFPRDSVASQTYNYANRTKIIPNATISGRIGNEYTILRLHNAIRNYNIRTYSFVDRLDFDLVKNHKFRLKAGTFFDGIPLYNIKVSKDLDNVEVIGKIYISKTNFAIHKMEYTVYEKNPSRYRKESFYSSGRLILEKGKLGKLLYSIKVEYQSYNNKMYLNYISFNNTFDILQPPKFAPIAAEIDSDRKRFKLILNNPPLEEDAQKKEKYKLYYQGRKLNIAKVEVKKNSVFLYPVNANIVFDRKLVEFYKTMTSKGVGIEIKDVRDIYGNIVNKSEAINYNQFSEFFVQQLSLKTKRPIDSLYMIKTIPIYKGQHIVPPANLTDYWMNTPLKNK